MTLRSTMSSSSGLLLVCTGGLLGLAALLIPNAAQAQHWGRPTYAPSYAPPPVLSSTPYPGRLPQFPLGRYGNRGSLPGASADTVYDNDPAAWALSEAQMNQRCNIGRLVGGLIGGGMGYATSRQDGRTWAVPLGTLLGSQMGCNVGTGRGPVPW
jgi:hypothetical protein